MEVKIVPGHRHGSVYYTCAADSGFFYRINKTKNGKHFLRCVEKNCPARACRDDLVFTKLGEGHNHLQDEQKEEALQLKASMLDEACATSESVKGIFVRRSASTPADVASKLAPPATVKSMRRCRRKVQPDMPRSLEEFGEICRTNVRFGQIDGETFCRGTSGNGNSLSVLFLAEGLRHLITAAKEVHIDGTFKTRPHHPTSSQLLTIMVVHYGFAFPCSFALMASRTTEAYDALFKKIRQIIPEFKPRLILTDFESALVRALHANFPEAQKTGCWFHYCQAILRKSGVLGMRRLLVENLLARKALKMLMCVPLLPTINIEDGVEFITNFIRLNSLEESFSTLLRYHRRQWLEKVGADSISVFNRTRRTNNDSESLHAALKRILGVRNPNVWEFTDGIRNITAATIREIRAFVDEGLQIKAIAKRKYLLNSQRIKHATMVLQEDGNIGAYLEVVAYSVQGLIRQNLADEEQVEVENEEYLLARLPGNLLPEFNVNDNTEVEPDQDDDEDTDDVAADVVNDVVDDRVEEVAEAVNLGYCMICLTSRSTMALIPCGHIGLCDECCVTRQRLHDIPPDPEDVAYDRIIDHGTCPLDRIPVQGYLRLVTSM